MENQENRFFKTRCEAIKILVPRTVPGNTKNKTKQIKTKQNKTQNQYAVNVFEGLAEFTQILFVADSSGAL